MEHEKSITVIPPDPKYDLHIRIEQKRLNVAAYCRVSTRFEQQENSYEAQIAYYTKLIESNMNWNFVGFMLMKERPRRTQNSAIDSMK